MRHGISIALLALTGVIGHAFAAQAGMIPTQVSVTPQGNNYLYSYSIVLPTDAVLQPGNFFTIYGFQGLVAQSATTSGTGNSGYWTFASSSQGPTPGGLMPPVTNNTTNISWTYDGPVIQGSQTGLGTFSAVSIYPTTTQSWFTAITGTVSGKADANITPTTVPVPTASPPALPEPATFVLAALGVPFLGMLRRRQR